MADNSLKKGRYTKYSNKIGLHSNSRGSFIKNDTGVVLNFPFKDTVLEAGMSKEDKGREERFLHIEIDSKDIDTLEEPKVLTDFRLINEHGETPLTANSDVQFFDENGELKQNLLIKGNNLLALHTLKNRLAGKIKLIYIDPPYNTGGDGFRYNDSFNHSAWLAFMKNRLEVARDLLSEDGSIFISCDDNEQPYLRVLADEIFGRDNFIASNIWQKIHSTKNDAKYVSDNHEYVTVYAKNREMFSTNLLERTQAMDDRYKNPDNDTRGAWQSGDLVANEERTNGYFDIIGPTGKVFNVPKGKHWVYAQKTLNEMIADNRVWFGKNGDAFPRKKRFLSEVQGGRKPTTWWSSDEVGHNQEAKREIIALNLDVTFDTPKPERLIKRVLEVASKEGDIVLDFCLGSGTTASVAQKMNRRWVGVEQMDYIDTVAKERLKKVISGEQGGISKSVDWNGGGSFVYFELKKYNQEYVERIMEATSLSELEDLYVDMRNNAFLKFWFDRSHFEKDEDFRQLDLDGRKNALADVLDENQLYLNYGDMNDTRHNVTADEKALTDTFYGTK